MQNIAQRTIFKLKNIFSRSSLPSSTLASPADWVLDLFGGLVRSKVIVNKTTSDKVAAFNRAVVLLSESVAKVPFEVFKKTSNGLELDESHPLYYLLNISPNYEQTPFTFFSRLVTLLMKSGNAYYFIDRNEKRQPVALIDINDRNVRPFRVVMDGKRIVMYDVEGFEQPLFAEDVFHVLGWGDNPILGQNPIVSHAETLGISIAAQETQASLFGNLGNVGGLLETDREMSADLKRNMVRQWQEQYTSSKNAGKIGVLSHGLKFKSVQLSPADSKVLESSQFQIEEISRITGVPPHKLFQLSDSTMNNMEVMNSQFVETVDSICVRIEQEARRKLLIGLQQRKIVVRANLYELSRGDMKSRASYFHSMIQDGVLKLNEVRQLEGFKRVPAGDVFFRPLNMAVVNEEGDFKQIDNSDNSDNSEDGTV